MVIVLVMDNLNIHDLSCLYEAFEPSEARRLVGAWIALGSRRSRGLDVGGVA
jgi:hypothetical protein